MLKIFQTFVLLLVVTAIFAQDKTSYNKRLVSSVKEDGCITNNISGNYQQLPSLHNPYAPAGTVPFPINYNDYGTNGNNIRKLIVLGDTVILAQDINPDMSGPPPTTTNTRVQYQVSYDGGTTWLTEALNTGGTSANRWANIVPIFNSGLRSIIALGRMYGTSQTGVSMIETMLGLGSFNFYQTPSRVYRDYFGAYKNSTMVGGIISGPSGDPTDTLWYMNFDYSTQTYGTPVMISAGLEENFRYNFDIASNGLNMVAARWQSTSPQCYVVHESTNGGTTWSTGTQVGLSAPYNGDSCAAWLCADVIYKPNSTTKGLAFSTLYNLSGSNYSTREGSKVLYWSPTVNGGNPVVIIDYHKYGFMNDTALWNNNQNYSQVGVVPLSHPSLAYSADGTVLYCAFSARQKDTSSYTITQSSKNYHFQDIFICKSTDDGATWSNAKYVTKTYKRDELYPTLSRTGNTATTFNVVYNESGSPGSFTFTDNTPADTTYTVFQKLVFANLMDVPTGTIGINNISSEVPAKYALMQNYPNPFNPTTTIRFTLPKASLVTIKVYNITGQLVSVLAQDEATSVGTKEVKFDGTNLSSGIYFYSIQAGSFKETKKMMLIK